MAKFIVTEEVIGNYEYQASIDENTVGDFNKYMASTEGYEPLSVKDVEDILMGDSTNPRYHDTYTKVNAWNGMDYTCHLNDKVSEWFHELAYDHPMGCIDICDSFEIDTDVIQ